MTKTAILRGPGRGIRLLLLLTSVVISACVAPAPEPAQSRDDETALVQATVADPDRADRLLALIAERDRLIDETGKLLGQYHREMKAINADYDASRDVIIEMIDYYNRERARKQLAFIDLVTKMKRETTAAEWAVIAEFQQRNFDPRKLIYRPLEGS